MKREVPTLNKTQLKNVLQMSPPGSHVGFIDWANIVVRPVKGEERGTPWREVYIPYRHATDAYTTMGEMQSVFNAIARVWGEIGVPSEGSKGFIKFKNRDCFYLCFNPKQSGEIHRA